MANSKVVLEQLIEKQGGILVRQKKHKVYRFPDGRTFTIPKTPTCYFAYDNALADLRNILGLNPVDRGTPGERREKRIKRRSSKMLLPINTESPSESSNKVAGWRDKLLVAALQLTPPNSKRKVERSR